MLRPRRLPFWLTFGLCVVLIEAAMAGIVWISAPPGTHWLGGSIKNTSDQAVYLSYLRQGEDGDVLLSDRFAVEPHARRFDPVWSTAGLLARTGIPIILLHEIMRWLFTLILAWSVYAAARSITKTERDARLATVLAFGGVSVGWLYSLYLSAIHLWTLRTYAAADVVTEFAISPTLVGGAHMILSLALLIAAFRLTWRAWEHQSLRDGIGATACAGLLASFHPYFAPAFVIFQIMSVLHFRKRLSRRVFFLGIGLSLLAAIPSIVIYLPLAFDPVFRTHHLDVNILPIPPIVSWIFVLAPFLGAFSWMMARQIHLFCEPVSGTKPRKTDVSDGDTNDTVPDRRMQGHDDGEAWSRRQALQRHVPATHAWLVAWLVTAIICLVLPFPWTRKYLEGLGLVLIFLTLPAWFAIREWILRQRPRPLSRSIAVLLLFFACLTPLHLITSQLAWIGPDPSRQRYFYVSDDIFRAWNWLRSRSSEHDVILTDDPWINVWTPAYTDRTVWVGHDHETPDYQTKLSRWKELMKSTDPTRVKEILDATPVTDLLLVTTSTRATYPGWLAPEWTPVFQTETSLILQRDLSHN